MLFDDLRTKAKESFKAGDKESTSLYRLVIGQAQQLDDQSDEKVLAIIRKMIKSNNETLDSMGAQDSSWSVDWIVRAKVLRDENVLLGSFLPKSLSNDEIRTLIVKHGIDVKAAKNDGQAVGLVMKAIKADNLVADGAAVKSVVSALRLII